MQDLQRAKIIEIAGALTEAGLLSLNEQAEALGLPKSTAWTIVKSQCKGTGLTASTINRILASPKLPHSVRIKVIEYAKEKLNGRYGHRRARIRKFEAKLDHTLLDGSKTLAPARLAV
jgi:predicted DNA-binding transcriptional regulator AlpA